MRHVAIVGASLAGVSAAEGLRERGFDGDITLLDAEASLPYDRPPLSKGALKGDQPFEDLLLRPPSWYEEQGVHLRLGQPVRALDTSSRTLHLHGHDELRFDGLVIATGSAARDLPIPCGDPSGIHRLRTLEDSRRLAPTSFPDATSWSSEPASSVWRWRRPPACWASTSPSVETATTPLNRVFGDRVGEWIRQLHERNGVDVRCAVSLQEISADGRGFTLRFADGLTLPADVVVTGVGAAPQTAWLDGSGIAVANGIRCSADLRTSVPDVVAAGDVVQWHNSLFGEEMRIEHWTNAVEQGRHAAGTVLGERQDYQAVPYFWTDQHDAKIRFVGRASGADDIVVDEPKPGAFIALFGRGGVLRGAVCVNTPRRLAQYREAISTGTSWEEAAGELSGHRPPALTTRGPGAGQANRRCTS